MEKIILRVRLKSSNILNWLNQKRKTNINKKNIDIN